MGRYLQPFLLLMVLASGCGPAHVGGIHARLAYSNHGGLRVVELGDAPGARRAGHPLQVEDRILSIDGSPVRDHTMREVVEALRGEVGTYVELRISRGDERLTVRVERRPFRNR